ncbi:MAG: DUF1178 family protein [Proteobacteria bacterium]|nr:DUF1178 family protein [Pseudomonadota bacterium]
MIKYTVRCADGHDFDGWYKDSATYERLAGRAGIECPLCGSTDVARAPMAPRIAKSRGDGGAVAQAHAQEVAERILEAVQEMRKSVEANCDYVGPEFADEARRIHYGEADERGIYGEATNDEARELDEEGIEVHRLPTPPRRNS